MKLVSFFRRGSETVLGETSDPLEVFMTDECDDTTAESVIAKVKVGMPGADTMVCRKAFVVVFILQAFFFTSRTLLREVLVLFPKESNHCCPQEKLALGA